MRKEDGRAGVERIGGGSEAASSPPAARSTPRGPGLGAPTSPKCVGEIPRFQTQLGIRSQSAANGESERSRSQAPSCRWPRVRESSLRGVLIPEPCAAGHRVDLQAMGQRPPPTSIDTIVGFWWLARCKLAKLCAL